MELKLVVLQFVLVTETLISEKRQSALLILPASVEVGAESVYFFYFPIIGDSIKI